MYDFRICQSSDCATFVVAESECQWHTHLVMSQDDILAELVARGVTQGQIAETLGITRPNANKLFNPAKKTGKVRLLSYDEGMKLIRDFRLDQPDDAPIAVMSVPVARLAVQYIAQQLGVKIDADDDRVEDLARDIQAYSEFAASAQLDENLGRAEGWLDGRRSLLRERS